MHLKNQRRCRYCILGDGCNMEGVAQEAASLAGHWGLGKLICFYDDNEISIDGNTDISFTEDVPGRYVANGWHVRLRPLLCCRQHVPLAPRAAPALLHRGARSFAHTTATPRHGAVSHERIRSCDTDTHVIRAWHHGVQVLDVADGNTDLDAMRKAIEDAKAVTDKPTLIVTHTLIGYGSPNKVNSYAAHGAPLGADETALTREQLKWEYGEFEVPGEVTEVRPCAHYPCTRRVHSPNEFTKRSNRRFPRKCQSHALIQGCV